MAEKTQDSRADAEAVALETERQLQERGWVLWQCATLNGEVIVVIRDDQVTSYPVDHVVYTEWELRHLFSTRAKRDASQLRLVHEAKKAGAVVGKEGQARMWS